MRRKPVIKSGTALLLATIVANLSLGRSWLEAADKADAPETKTNVAKAAAKPVEKFISKPGGKSEDEKAIIAMGVAYVKSFCSGDAAALVAMYAPDAEYIDEQGTAFRGREEIEGVLKAGFAHNPGATIQLNIDSIRFVGPGLAFEDGTTVLTPKGESALPIYSQYSAVHVKTDGKWLTASVREQAPKDRRSHKAQLKNVAFLLGDWVDESGESVVKFSCVPVDEGNFLLRTYTIHLAGQEALSGTQRIGWDPVSGKLRSWIFDSAGGFSEGYWHRDGNTWVLRSHGVTADGRTASSTTVYTIVNDHTMTWQSVDHEIAGIEIPDGNPVTIVRRAPAPEIANSKPASK